MSIDQAEAIRQMVRRALIDAIGEAPGQAPGQPPGQPPGQVVASQPADVQESTKARSPHEYHSPWVGTAYESHHSQRLLVESGRLDEPGLASWPVIAGQECPLEKRPCDDCGRCRSLGF
jgi:hypothetical protein